MSRCLAGALGMLLISAGACDSSAGPKAGSGDTASRKTGPVVARVNGDAITLEEVRAVCRESGLAADLALARLVDERLLAQYAEKRGYGELENAEIELARARVRALVEQAVERPGGALEQRAQRLEDLLKKLREATTVSFDEPAVREALADERTLGAGT
jgi:hypothetical protein